MQLLTHWFTFQMHVVVLFLLVLTYIRIEVFLMFHSQKPWPASRHCLRAIPPLPYAVWTVQGTPPNEPANHTYAIFHYVSAHSLCNALCMFCQNAMRATVETHEMSPTLPPIKVRVSLGSEDLTIKVHENTKRYIQYKRFLILNYSTVYTCVLTLYWQSSTCSSAIHYTNTSCTMYGYTLYRLT